MRVQIMLAGVGGQGILFASRIFSELGRKLGMEIMGSETHGMSQRGGSVVAHVKIGNFQSPMIRTGAADILYSFEKNETYRNLKFLKNGGVCFVNCPAGNSVDSEVLEYLKQKKITVSQYDAVSTALKMGSIMTTNIVLIGYSIGTGLVPFSLDDLEDVLRSASREKNLESNLRALEIGYRAGKP
jgi:indolepyruvate ferredoxin oxidoreductase beta subunit